MQIVASIKKARENGVSDDLILQEIRKQNPEKEAFFKKAEERGAVATKILDEIIKQNTPVSPPPPPTPETPPPASPPPQMQSPVQNQTTDKTLLTKEAQEEEEDMRQNFLKRIEAKERGESVDGGAFFTPSKEGPGGDSSASEMAGEDPIKGKGIPKILIILLAGILLLSGFAFLIFSLF